ncbi:MAG: ABC-F family ATP-binding cassette domain-containing protein [Fidelibacterota bacterium]|jgi:ATP-binding cassette subfamily F protein 3|tara:strand:+ start:7734 stop:9596 length:1863 start_codon:yes stop_codon:yes gene_type:complete
MIRIESLSKSFPDGDLFNNVNIFIKQGMRLGLVGPNGSGKTTLLRIMLGKDTPDSGSIQVDSSTSIGYLAQDIIVGSNHSILEEVLLAYPEVSQIQNKMLQLSELIAKEPENLNLVNELGEVQNRFEALEGWRLEDKAKKILSGLGFLDKQLKEPMDVLSGGWRMRVALASILLQEPDILFLDEPTNHLDLEATIWLESFLANWKGGLVMISHDRTFLDQSVNHILEIDIKKVTLYNGNYSKYKIDKALRLEQNRSAYKNQQKEIRETERFIERFRSKSTKSKQVQSRVKMLDKMDKIEAPFEDNNALNLVLPQPSRSPLNVASCRNLTKHFQDIQVFNEMNMMIERGNKIGLVGHNGAGKSTLLKMLAGVESVTKGAVRIGSGVDTAYYAQHQLDVLDKDDTIFGTIQKVSPGWGETQIRTYLGSFLFKSDEIEKLIKVLSGGEKARLAMARMLVEPSHLLLLDEPTNHLDMVSRNIVETALVQFSGSIVCISHDRHFLNNVTNHIIEVGNGSIQIYEGNYEYYEWKKSKDSNLLSPIKEKKESKGKADYEIRKKKRNRISWIKRRFKNIEDKLEEYRLIIKDVSNENDYKKLQKAVDIVNNLENEYLELMEEQEILIS